MKLYRAVWYGVSSLLTVLGAGIAIALWSPFLLAVTALAGAAIGGVMTIGYLRSQTRLPRSGRVTAPPEAASLESNRASTPATAWRRVWRRVGGVSPATAVGAVSIGGWASVLGAWVPPVLVLIAGSSPYAVWTCRKGLQTSQTDASGQGRMRPLRSSPDADASPAFSRSRTPRSLTDAELCRAWRRSFSLLLASPSPASRVRIVQARQRYLDEFERRNPDGLSAWLESGPRAAEDPRRYLA